MATYRKKPVEIEAFLLGEEPPEWFNEKVEEEEASLYTEDNKIYCKIETLEGTMRADEGVDYIIKGVDGEIYPCKKDIFERTYEKV
jgi:hypothetical protein